MSPMKHPFPKFHNLKSPQTIGGPTGWSNIAFDHWVWEYLTQTGRKSEIPQSSILLVKILMFTTTKRVVVVVVVELFSR